MTPAETTAVITMLKAAYPRQPITRATVAVYAGALADIDPATLMRAARLHVQTSQWFPTVAELRTQVATEATAHLPEPELAWKLVQDEMGRVGHLHAPRFQHPEVAAAVDAVGWQSMCTSTQPGVSRAHFVAAYRVLRDRAVRAAQVGPPARLPSPTLRLDAGALDA